MPPGFSPEGRVIGGTTPAPVEGPLPAGGVGEGVPMPPSPTPPLRLVKEETDPLGTLPSTNPEVRVSLSAEPLSTEVSGTRITSLGPPPLSPLPPPNVGGSANSGCFDAASYSWVSY